MSCAELEILLCDYVDGTLAPEARAEVERHIAGCPGCAELAKDAQAAVSFMEHAAEVEPPPVLMMRILEETRSGRHGRLGHQGNWLQRLIRPVLQPKLVMSMAMTIFSFAMLARFVGMPERQLRPSDLNPGQIWAALDDRVYRTWQRSVKYYESIRLVYQIQSRLREWQDQQDEEIRTEEASDPGEGRKLPVSGTGKNQ